MPTVFYFTLTASESLTLSSYSQPVEVWQTSGLRIFSMTLPGHVKGKDPKEGMSFWAHSIEVLEPFFNSAAEAIEDLAEEGLCHRIGVAGLSRGAFVATHVAARCALVESILGFAPLTDLTVRPDFVVSVGEEALTSLALVHLIPKLTRRALRFYIGNRDILVSSGHCCDFILRLADAAFQERIRSPNVELRIGPSTGHKGHGTQPEAFVEGAHWLAEVLNG